jgi:FSR family fosmidomycin resistance protein-like MFS transporter
LISLVAPVPFLFGLPSTQGVSLLMLLGFSGFLLLSSVPVNIVMAQELAPGNAATASSLVMGFGWGIGSILLTPFGAISDLWGLEWSMKILGCLPLLAALCVPFIHHQAQDLIEGSLN